MGSSSRPLPEWVNRGKTIRGLIEELEAFEDKDLLVQISLDDGKTQKPISLVMKAGGFCLLVNCETSFDEE